MLRAFFEHLVQSGRHSINIHELVHELKVYMAEHGAHVPHDYDAKTALISEAIDGLPLYLRGQEVYFQRPSSTTGAYHARATAVHPSHAFNPHARFGTSVRAATGPRRDPRINYDLYTDDWDDDDDGPPYTGRGLSRLSLRDKQVYNDDD